MALIGLSVFIAAVSFLCYRHPPTSWSFLGWIRPKQLHDAPSIKHAPDGVDEGKSAQTRRVDRPAPPTVDPPPPHLDVLVAKAEADRKAMPPPPAFRKKPVSTSQPAATPPSPPDAPAAAAALTPRLAAPEPSPSRPSFPALNSAQRASSSHDPPRQHLSSSHLQPPLRSPHPSRLSAPSRTPAPLPNRNPQPNRAPPNRTSNALLPPAITRPNPTSTNNPSAQARQKVQLQPGHSPLDWAALTADHNRALNGLPAGVSYLRVPPSLLKQHNGRKGRDAWTVLGAKVYNITPYLPYHPGGEPELLRCAGRDGSRLFADVHPWVNWEGMLEACLVGLAVSEDEVKVPLEEMD